ncbi:hypothetical protein GOP47_0007975 [Adiantum capillus-veneris]|uniref:Uncharacterized protein n=1 Tax=Adiantum capillus-veneris TaxID=13818 RepID=A0A9D4V1Q7_ADICA|nr:hypothetical protein GOP47_0007975 [Adiantum capillus-veneris]
MQWSVILASLKHSHCPSLRFASFCSRCEAASSSQTSVRSSVVRSTLKVSAIPKSCNGSTSQITVRAATTIAESGKSSSAPQGKTSKISKERFSSEGPSTQGSTKSTRFCSQKNDTLPASRDVKAAHVEDETHIAYLESSRAHGNRGTQPSYHAMKDDSRCSSAQLAFTSNKNYGKAGSSVDDSRCSSAQLAFTSNKNYGKAGSSVSQVSKDSDDGDAGKVAARMTKGTKGKPKARSYESLKATSESKGSSRGQVLSRERCFGSNSKAGNIIEGPALASSDSSEVRSDYLSEAETTSEFVDEVGENAGNNLKNTFLKIAFPVTVFAEWWFYCFLRGYRSYPETFYCLDKLYVWLGAYQRAHWDATGIYVNSQCAAALSNDLERLKNAVISKAFRWSDAMHIYLRSPESSSIVFFDADSAFSFQDRVVQEVLYLVLEPIFEARFNTRSHSSRPGRGAHTALRAAQRSFLGCKWFISGDLSVFPEGNYGTHIMDSVLKVVKESRVTFLLRYAFLGRKSEKAERVAVRSSFSSATQGSCERLKHLLCNVVLDPLDWWMDEKISNFTKQEPLRTSVIHPSDQSSQRKCLKPWRHPCKLEYVRYGTKFWVGCDGTEKEVKSIRKEIFTFLNTKFGKCFENNLSVSHISVGLNILDHVMSQKIVYSVYVRRKASSGKLFEKRAFRVRLRVKASIECCIKYLKQVGVPASLQHIEEVLSVLDYWYCYAENKAKVLMYCKLALCQIYSMKGSSDKCEEGSVEVDIAEQMKKAVETVVSPNTKHGGNSFIRIPEHEKVFREHAWLQSRAMTPQLKDSFKNMRKTSPQQNMSEVLWQYLREANSDNDWDPFTEMQTSGQEQGSVGEELAESAG